MLQPVSRPLFRLRFLDHDVAGILELPTNATLNKILPPRIGGSFNERLVSVKIASSQRFQSLEPHAADCILHNRSLIAINSTTNAPKPHPIIMHKRCQERIDTPIAMLVGLADGERFRQLVLPASHVEDQVAGKLLQLGRRHGRLRVDAVQEVQQSRVVRLHVPGQDARVDDEHVGALGEEVTAVRAYYRFTQLAHCEEDVWKVVWPFCC